MFSVAWGLQRLGLTPSERVGVYLPKVPEAVCALFGTSLASGVFVPINPLLKPAQVAHILQDCNVRVLFTASERARLLAPVLPQCRDLHTLVLVDDLEPPPIQHLETIGWHTLLDTPERPLPTRIDMDMAAILYTSGSTGKPKGVVLSHRNMVTGAASVVEYLGNHSGDKLLAVLPLSFDAGLSQLTTAFSVGAQVVLMDFLLPRDVIKAAAREGITGITAVPPLWIQLAQLSWPKGACRHLRYIANTGGALPRPTLHTLRQALPKTRVFLMYGLTEAFRSTYLPPQELDRRPDSIGKAIPNSEILVVRPDGSPCGPDEPGELVHRGSLVSLGYWNDPERTAGRFRPTPGLPSGLPTPELAVWSGDTVRMDQEGFLYFIGRTDHMIKTSGYRVSPTEVEEVLYASGQTSEAVALGIPHPLLGQAVVAVIRPCRKPTDPGEIISHCKKHLPNFMTPLEVVIRAALPHTPNGKIDRNALAAELQDMFQGGEP
jgi:acyl-CoA ligase (AMP-forming) (exosortase A-associated)